MKKQKEKNYKLRSKVYSVLGYVALFAGAASGAGGYGLFNYLNGYNSEMTINEETLNDFVTFLLPQGTKLNFYFAFPILIGLFVFVLITIKKNKEFFKDKVTFDILLAIIIIYLIYSVAETTLFVLIGAFSGAVIMETVFVPAARRNKRLSIENHEADLEYNKEKRRILARQQADKDLNGSV